MLKLGIVLLSVCTLLERPAPAQTNPEGEDHFDAKTAVLQSSLFLGIMHGFRIATEDGTRQELGGPFFRDYTKALGGVRGWGDGDPFIVNYVGHPFQGAVSGYIQIHNDPAYRRLEFGNNRLYWKSRLRATAFAAAASAQFELGPISEASIGNVGKNGPHAGAVDLVVTPLGGLGVMVAEDFLDQHVVKRIESRTDQPMLKLLVRSFLNPNRSFANVMRFRWPWHRERRGGVFGR